MCRVRAVDYVMLTKQKFSTSALSFLRRVRNENNFVFSTSYARTKPPKTSGADPRLHPKVRSKPLHMRLALSQSTDFSHVQASTFDQLNVPQNLISALKSTGIIKPNLVQAYAIPKLLSKESDFFLGAETGSGKTLAYVIPVVSNLLKEEREALEVYSKLSKEDQVSKGPLDQIRKLYRPRALIVAPSRELVNQISAVLKALCHNANFSVLKVHAKSKRRLLMKSLQEKPVDVLVTTPGGLEWSTRSSDTSFGKKGLNLRLSDLKYCIVDEADVIFEKEYPDTFKKILKNPLDRRNQILFRIYPKEYPAPTTSVLGPYCQFIFVSATLPISLDNLISKEYPRMKRIISPSFHAPLKGVEHQFVRLNGSTTKANAVVDILKRSIANGDQRILIFCNKSRIASQLHAYLVQRGYTSFLATADTEKDSPMFDAFLKIPEREENIKPIICVSTDLYSRGMDTQHVSHVIMHDFPSSTVLLTLIKVDYIHRAGRTGRNGQGGRVTSIVTTRENALANLIREAVQKKRKLVDTGK